MTNVVPFPRTRDCGFVSRQAAMMDRYSPRAAENYLATQLAKQRCTMEFRGVDQTSIREQIAALEAAIRREHGRMRLIGGVA